MSIHRQRLTIEGTVQGVGFRPFVYRLAAELGINGWVSNGPQGVIIEAEASQPTLDAFALRLQWEMPAQSTVTRLAAQSIPVQGDEGFSIRQSSVEGSKSALILPDLATCPDCLRDITDPDNRRYRYPFTNCTNCGPRYSIIQRLPYDRANTTMASFTMCEACQAEYENPLDRRFHAQPNACPVCGPRLSLLAPSGDVLAAADDALRAAAEAVLRGGIVAVKGLGGFHLLVDASSSEAVTRLRACKGRYEKPLALMAPSMAGVESICMADEAERALLSSAAAPIVLLSRRRGADIAYEVAPESPYLGVMLPYTPLHHLLLAEIGVPVVATSGNRSGEPLCTDEADALARLAGIADVFLMHDRPIARPVDDSVVCSAAGEVLTLRRARGYAPLPVDLPAAQASILAVGAQQKSTTALLNQGHVFLSQHLGDLDTPSGLDGFTKAVGDLPEVYEAAPVAAAADLHPDYASTRYAESLRLPVLYVQHHDAHVLAAMAEHQLEPPVLGVAWDGNGLGSDGTLWGGEFLLVERQGFRRLAHLRPFPLPGGDVAAREPRRSLLGLLYAAFGEDLPRGRLKFTPAELDLLLSALRRGVNAPWTSSAGRLFDAVAALAGLRQRTAFEGQAAMLLEYLAGEVNTDECYPFDVTPITAGEGPTRAIIDWKLMLAALLGEPPSLLMSARFHNTMAEIVTAVAILAGVEQVVLSGGCFQNRLLLGRTVKRLRAQGFAPYWGQRIPVNDGGIALGQITAAQYGGGHVFSSSG